MRPFRCSCVNYRTRLDSNARRSAVAASACALSATSNRSAARRSQSRTAPSKHTELGWDTGFGQALSVQLAFVVKGVELSRDHE